MGAKIPVAQESEAQSAVAMQQQQSGVPTEPGWYRLGIRSVKGQMPPRVAITFGGVCFPLHAYDENPTVKNDTIEYNQRSNGQRVYLDVEDLKSIRAAMGRRIVRVRNERSGRFAIIGKHQRAAQRPMPGDTPLEAFLYMTPCDPPGAAVDPMHESFPPPLVE